MGDRANIVVDDGGSRVFLYGHWMGSEAPEILRAALVRGESRWDDPQYLARIIFQQMVGKDDGTTGYGITAKIGDNEYPLLIVDCDKQVVRLEPVGPCEILGTSTEHGFSEYAALEEANWGTLDSGRKHDDE